MDDKRDKTADSDSLERQLDALAEEYLTRVRRGEDPSVSEYEKEHPELAPKIREFFPAMAFLEEVQSTEPAPGSDDSSPLSLEAKSRRTGPGRLGEFRLLREIGRGGMGVVYEAQQETLGRHVALKVLPFHKLTDPRRLERFQREARAAAGLQHPGIVPVYGMGEEEGIHYYVMQYIPGQGLDQVLLQVQRLRKTGESSASPPSPREQSEEPKATSDSSVLDLLGSSSDALARSDLTYFRSIARLGAQAAEALEYAHAQGVLHRDIKPSNLLLDAQGSIWITDFGLAKAEGSDDLTESGEMVGTLRYMPPERLRGWSDPRSDIYSLGLTLYELLTLEPAFDEVDRGLLMRKIAEEEPAAPRKIEPHLPRDLNTVLTKAMAKEPGQRYQAAGEFAADLRRFLAGEPIQARASSVLERGIKWARRRPTSAALIVVILLAVVIVLSGSLWYNSRLQAQVESTDEAKQDAEESFRKARDAVDRLAEIAQERLSGVPLLENVRKVLLEEVLEFHEKFLEERGEDPAVRLDAARAYLQAGDIYRWLGQAEKSRAALEAGLRLAEDVLIPFPQDAEPMLVLGNLYASLGTVSKNSGRNEESMEFFVDACEVFEEACRRFPERSDFRRRHVDCLGSLGILVKVENPEAAEEICRKEIELAREHAAVAPDLPARLALPMSQLHFSRLLAERGKRREALEIAASAHASLDQFSEQDRMTPQWKALMANVFDLLAMLYRSAGNGEQAEKAQNRSVALLDDLQKDFPLSSIYRSDLASHLSNLGALLQEGGKVSEAKAAYDRAADLFQKLLEEQPGVPQYRVRLARLYGNHSRLLQKDADGPETRWEEAGDYLEKALDLQRSLVEDFPEEPLYVDGLGGLLSSLGVLFMKTKRFEDSRKAFSEGIHLQTQLAEKLPERKETQLLLARLLYNFSNLLASEDDFREARAQLLLAFGALQSARRHDPGDPEARNGLLMMFTSILKIGIVLKEHSKALEFAREAAGEFGDDASLHFDFAGALAQAIALILEDESLTEEFRAQAVDEYAREAVHFLKASSDLGFQSPERARQDPRLEPLRGREDFQAWLATIETR